MQTITSLDQITTLDDNRIIGDLRFDHSKIIFHGHGNILLCPQSNTPSTLTSSTITFNGDNSVVYLGDSNPRCLLNLSLYNNSFCSIGSRNYFSSTLALQCSEQCNIVIGNDCLFSFGIWVRTSDVHLMFDTITHQRINMSKSVFIGDRVWVGQNATILKGSQIGSGAILGAGALTSGKALPSNTVWGGNPAKQIRANVFFHKPSSHAFTDADTKNWQHYPAGDDCIFHFDDNGTVEFLVFEAAVTALRSAEQRADYLKRFNQTPAHDRFFVGAQAQSAPPLADDTDLTIARLQAELASHRGVKRSGRLLADNVIRKLKGARGLSSKVGS